MQATQSNQDPTQRFLISSIANLFQAMLTPLYYAIRSDMGVQYSAMTPILVSAAFYCGSWGPVMSIISFGSANRGAVALYFVMMAVGVIRNVVQARRRRRVRDWSVGSWSTGRSLLEPLMIMFSRFIYRKWSANKWVRRMLPVLSTDDFIYYVAEPGALLLAAAALYSIGALLCVYPAVLAVGLICVRNDRQLYLYLKAHEIADGQLIERAVRSQFEGPSSKPDGIPIAQVPAAPAERLATDEESIFNRLSPELRMLLVHGADSEA